jgi:hypothetical protein
VVSLLVAVMKRTRVSPLVSDTELQLQNGALSSSSSSQNNDHHHKVDVINSSSGRKHKLSSYGSLLHHLPDELLHNAFNYLELSELVTLYQTTSPLQLRVSDHVHHMTHLYWNWTSIASILAATGDAVVHYVLLLSQVIIPHKSLPFDSHFLLTYVMSLMNRPIHYTIFMWIGHRHPRYYHHQQMVLMRKNRQHH